MEIEYRSSARISYVRTFLDIAVKSYNQAMHHVKELEVVRKKGKFSYENELLPNDMEGYMFHSRKYTEAYIETIIFLAIFLESYIYEQGAIVMGDKYVSTNLDTLKTHSKWLIIIKMICGKDMNVSLAHHGKFKELIKLRNSLVHHKSEDAFDQIKDGKLKERKLDFTKIRIDSFFVMLDQLFQELDELDPEGLHSFRIQSSLEMLEPIDENILRNIEIGF